VSGNLNRRESDMSARLINKIIAAKPKSAFLATRKQINAYLRRYFGDVPYEDMQDRKPHVMGQAAMVHLEFARTRKPDQAMLRVFNPTIKEHGYESSFTVVEMVNDNMPFLVDSVAAAINRHDLTIHMTMHPILRVRRGKRGQLLEILQNGAKTGQKESYVRFVIDREVDPQRRKLLKNEIAKVLSDVRKAVRDWPAMRREMLMAADEIKTSNRSDSSLRSETESLLQWMVLDHFTFLGYREYRMLRRGQKTYLRPVEKTGLGVLAGEHRGGRTVELTREMHRFTRSNDLLIITKANSRSTVHRHSYLDYFGIKTFDKDGNPAGEKRFIGLFTSVAYSENPRNIPLLRLKVNRVVEESGLDPSGHRGKSLLHILDTFPRDELFQSSVRDLVRTTNGILNLQDRRRVKFFLRRDTFRRFFSCIVYVPREKYTTGIRGRIEEILLKAFDGHASDSGVQITESPLARVHIIVHTGRGERPRISIRGIEKAIAATVVTWQDRLRENLIDRFGQDEGLALFREYGDCFPLAFEEDVSPAIACLDIKRVDGLLKGEHNDSLLLHQPGGAEADQLNFRTFTRDRQLLLSHVLPVLEDMGTDVFGERPYHVRLKSGTEFWIQDFELRYGKTQELDVDEAAKRFEEGFARTQSGEVEIDGLNRLILAAGLDWRQTSLVRCYTKYLLQLGIPFSQAYMEDVLVGHAGIVRRLVDQFELQFQPGISAKRREEELSRITASIRRRVGRAKNLDEDRILSAFSGAVTATLRSNFFQRQEDGEPKPYISIKLDPSELPEVPLPKPMFEIFVYSPRVEGVHLRGGRIARGGIRWSDRREDFRTEVLGLMKAQVVKNTVIVPTGAKGGFFPKQLPTGSRDEVMQEVIASYKMFICGLFDLTDNVAGDKVIGPVNVVRRDTDDPYLVVAADKGTATFSDIANGLSADYGFWLDDAFASGGSVGYDHKKMGITARGAWEAVRRHFREQGLNVQKDPFTVLGIGDMGGDVFGNGMLLSRKIKLVAAFNHQHIFLDPTPDMAASYRERQRLFKLPRSSWADYKDQLISKGGGVFSRQAKSIRLSAEARALLDTTERSMSPLALIHTMLKMPVDLLWNGGIGTYVKASTESHADVGDRSNDNLRVNASELRCKVVGEGGNLGLTQLGRIEFSQHGGRVNADFIDNSAGVDCSDREVNIKILLGAAEASKRLTRKARNKVLVEMTDAVAAFVLRNNYLQTQAISMMEANAADRLDESARLILNLEKTGLLDRDIEFLPDEGEIDERRQRNLGLTRPEIAVILSYAKIDLYNGLTSSGHALEDFLTTDPQRYFPPALRRRFIDLIPDHRLSFEILATLISNNIVNRMGPTFVQRVKQDTGADTVTIARSYVVAKEICQASEIWSDIESLDNQIPATLQQTMMFEASRLLRHACYWLIERYGQELDIVEAVAHLKPGMAIVYSRVFKFVSGSAVQRQKKTIEGYQEMGVPEKLARRMAGLLLTRGGLDITDLAVSCKRDVFETAEMYARMSDDLDIIWITRGVEALPVSGRWQAIARSNLRDEFYRMRRDLVESLYQTRSRKSPMALYESWLEKNASGVTKFNATLAEMKLRSETDFAMLSVAAQEFRKLVDD